MYRKLDYIKEYVLWKCHLENMQTKEFVDDFTILWAKEENLIVKIAY